jgi:hypothetical protein
MQVVHHVAYASGPSLRTGIQLANGNKDKKEDKRQLMAKLRLEHYESAETW